MPESDTNLVFLHGLESGPHGSKYRVLCEFGDVIAPDCEEVPELDDRMAIIQKALKGKTNLIIVGSSFGSLAALKFVQNPEDRDRVKSLILCAPAVGHHEMITITEPPPKATWILHGTEDTIVPTKAVSEYATRHRLNLTLVQDGHRLQNSEDVLRTIVALAIGQV